MLDTLMAFPPATLLAFLAGALVLNLTPGSDVLFAIASGLQGGPKAQAAAKDLIRGVANRPVSDAVVEDTARRISQLRATPDAREGLEAFLSKRPAAWVPQD